MAVNGRTRKNVIDNLYYFYINLELLLGTYFYFYSGETKSREDKHVKHFYFKSVFCHVQSPPDLSEPVFAWAVACRLVPQSPARSGSAIAAGH